MSDGVFSESNLTRKHPSSEQSLINYWVLLGSKVKREHQIGDLINE
jgi:hypothetical protein